MRYLYKCGSGSRRRVMHLTPYDPRTGEPTMRALCGSALRFDTTCNLPLGQPVCKRCRAEASRERPGELDYDAVIRKRRGKDERAESYAVEQIREAWRKHAHADDWGVPHFYETGLIAALRGEYDDADAAARVARGGQGA